MCRLPTEQGEGKESLGEDGDNADTLARARVARRAKPPLYLSLFMTQFFVFFLAKSALEDKLPSL